MSRSCRRSCARSAGPRSDRKAEIANATRLPSRFGPTATGAQQKERHTAEGGLRVARRERLLTAPLVRRTWAPREVTPILRHPSRYREKISAIAVVTISPVVAYLSDLVRHLRYPLTVVWDWLIVHRSARTGAWLRRHPRIHRVMLPPYALELNPVGPFCSYLSRALCLGSPSVRTGQKILLDGGARFLIRLFLPQ